MADATAATPRIDAPLRQQFVGQTVRVIGKVTELHGDTATVDAFGDVTIILSPSSNFEMGRYYEIIGKVADDLSVRCLDATDFGTNINMDNVKGLIQASQKHKEIFY